MQLLFLDDSVQKGHRGKMGKLVAAGGVLLDEAALRPLQERIDGICAQFQIPLGCEIKWSPPKGNWIREHLDEQARQDLQTRVLEAALEHEAKALVVIFDTGRTSLQGAKALRKALEYAFERATMHLEDEGKLGLIVADRPGGSKKEEEAFLEDVLSTIAWGTEYVQPKQIPINILTTPSHLVRHLQVADLVVGVTTAMVAGNLTFAEPLFPIVKQMLLRNAYDYIGGTGLKLFPKELSNLYYWVLGEDVFAKVAANSGWGLPREGFPYYSTGFDSSPEKANI
jgi:hypothetical protein